MMYDDAILVRINVIKDDENKLVATYRTTAINQTIKMFLTAKKHDMECYFNEFDTTIDDEYTDKTYYVKDVNIIFGSSESLPCIEVFIE